LDQPRVVYATEGRDSGTGGRFVEDLNAHRGDPEQVGSVTCDMSQAFLSGVNQHLPQAGVPQLLGGRLRKQPIGCGDMA
jgi:transposase